MFVVCVTLWVKPEHVDEFRRACETNVMASRLEHGNLRFDFLCAKEDPCKFFFYEVYNEARGYDEHHETAHYLNWRAKVEPWLSRPRESVQYESLLPLHDSEW